MCYILLIIYNCLVSAGAASKLSRLNGDPFFNSGPNDKKDDQHHPEQRLAQATHCHGLLLDHGLFFVDVNPWNNGKEVPRWGVAEIQKMSPSLNYWEM